MNVKNVIRHLKTINHHKWLVLKGCFRVGLYKQGIFHDFSKYGFAEFHIGIKYYQGTRSPNNAEREEVGYSSAWLHHKGRNKHHYEYWIDYGTGDIRGLTGMRMPEKYVVEMVMDRIAASKTYLRGEYSDCKPLEYYLQGSEGAMIHRETKELLERLLRMLATQGERKTFAYIRKYVLAQD